jgi:cathepsin L
MKFIALAIIVCFAFSAYAAISEKELEQMFVQWTHKNNKVYGVDMFQYRWQVWKRNAIFIENFNNQGNQTFTVAMNQFGDLTGQEFGKLYMGLSTKQTVKHNLNNVVQHVAIPASVDWRTKGAVTGIKNQGQCGSCWSFSATGSSEGAHFLQKGKALTGLSEQNLVDCSQSFGNEGCDGGLMDYAFEYIISNNQGIDSEASYPYTAETGTCKFNKANVAAHLVSYTDVTSGSESALTTDISQRGPVSVAIDASHSSFQFYSGGVYYEPACSATQLDHGVLAVGYGASGSSDYYIVKNSWGTDWGMSGYIWMSRNRSNNCGIATMASFPCATSSCMPM